MFSLFQKPTNQTEFNLEAPILTEPDLAQIDPRIARARMARRLLYKKLIFILGAGLIVVAGVMVALDLFRAQDAPTSQAPTPTLTPTPTPIDTSLLGQARALKQAFELNDPSNETLYFPNVSQEIYLDKPKKR